MTKAQQSEISAIVKGRQVIGYDVLVRIAGGLAIPREHMGLSFGAYAEEVERAESSKGVHEDVLRRYFEHLLALGAMAACGGQVTSIGELAPGLAVPEGARGPAVPDRPVDVAVIRRQTDHLRVLGRTYGGQASAAVALAEWAEQRLAVDASDAARRALLAALSDLHTISGWCCHDVGAVARSHYHFGRAVELATDADDAYPAAYAMRHAGMMLIHRSEPNNALKLLQLGGHLLTVAPRDDPRVPVLRSELSVVSAYGLARLHPQAYQGQAHSYLAAARDGWEPPSPHARADMDLITAQTLLNLGQLDAAEAAVRTSIQTWKKRAPTGARAWSRISPWHGCTCRPESATGSRLAAAAIDDAARLRSGLARELWLLSLADTLDSRPGSDAQGLAHRAREISATQV